MSTISPGRSIQLEWLTRSQRTFPRPVCPDFGRLGANASLPLCILPHFNAYELQRFTSWVALLAGFSRRSRAFILRHTRTLF